MRAKVAIITDPPTTVVHLRGGRSQIGGSFLAIRALQDALEEKGCEVQTYIALSSDSLVYLSDPLDSVGFPQLETMSGMRISALPARDEFGAFILSLKGERIPTLLSQLLDVLDARASRSFVFVTAGPKSAEVVKQLASLHRASVHVLERPGVARITRKGRDYVLPSNEAGPSFPQPDRMEVQRSRE